MLMRDSRDSAYVTDAAVLSTNTVSSQWRIPKIVLGGRRGSGDYAPAAVQGADWQSSR